MYICCRESSSSLLRSRRVLPSSAAKCRSDERWERRTDISRVRSQGFTAKTSCSGLFVDDLMKTKIKRTGTKYYRAFILKITIVVLQIGFSSHHADKSLQLCAQQEPELWQHLNSCWYFLTQREASIIHSPLVDKNKLDWRGGGGGGGESCWLCILGAHNKHGGVEGREETERHWHPLLSSEWSVFSTQRRG